MVVAPGCSIAERPAGSVTLWLGDTVFMLGVVSVEPVGEVLSTLPGAVPEARALPPEVSSVFEEATLAFGVFCVAVALPAEGLLEVPALAPPPLADPVPPVPLPLPEPPEPPPCAKHTALHRPATTIMVFVVVVFFMEELFVGLRGGFMRVLGVGAVERCCSRNGPGAVEAVRRSCA